MNDFEVVIGLEVHAQLNTESKIFCSCSTEFESFPNTNICPVCCGYPGTLPVFNRRVLELAIRVCLVLNCKINKNIHFERKNYFYPDLPKNFQISQYKMPLGKEGCLELPTGKKVRIDRVHIEEDAGKLIHKDNHSLIDFNRTGIPLLEIVSYPDINSPQEACDYLACLRLVLLYINVSDCDMEKGSLRCDANISLREKGISQLGTKVELKNMNTFKGIKAALEYETKRQVDILNKGEKVIQETRLWDARRIKTLIMRAKEEAHDYRYFPEPDLLDFSIPGEFIETEKGCIEELPLDKRKRFLKEYGISEKEIGIFIDNLWLADFFEQIIRFYPDTKEVANWLLGPFLEQVNNLDGKFDSVKISAQNFAKIIKYFSQGKMNNLAAKKALFLSITSGEDIDEIIKREKLIQLSGEDELICFVEEVIQGNSKAVKEYLEGRNTAIMFLVGQVMKKTKGRANPKVARTILERRLKE